MRDTLPLLEKISFLEMLRTIFLMWRRLAYFFGADPARLARRYGYASVKQ